LLALDQIPRSACAYASRDTTPAQRAMARNFPLNHPERICWGCDRYCPAQSLGRVMHPVETQRERWHEDWGIEPSPKTPRTAQL
jgi:hypothetical protein